MAVRGQSVQTGWLLAGTGILTTLIPLLTVIRQLLRRHELSSQIERNIALLKKAETVPGAADHLRELIEFQSLHFRAREENRTRRLLNTSYVIATITAIGCGAALTWHAVFFYLTYPATPETNAVLVLNVMAIAAIFWMVVLAISGLRDPTKKQLDALGAGNGSSANREGPTSNDEGDTPELDEQEQASPTRA